MTSKHTEDKAVKSLSQKHDLEVNASQKRIVELWGQKARRDVGNGSRGKIDFLINYCGYTHTWLNCIYSIPEVPV